MEIEAKFLASITTFHALQQRTTLGPFQLIPVPEPELQQNTYYDTADQLLQHARFGLRIRQIGERQIATLKGEATVSDGLYTRGEWEQDVTSADPQHWPPGTLRDRVLALTQAAALVPTITIVTTRVHIYAACATATPFAEISLDQGTIHAGMRQEPFRELEIELLPNGDRSDFDRLLTLLRQHFPLTPEPRSKLERALALRGT